MSLYVHRDLKNYWDWGAQDGHFSSHAAPELCDLSDEKSFFYVLFLFSHNIFLPIHTHKCCVWTTRHSNSCTPTSGIHLAAYLSLIITSIPSSDDPPFTVIQYNVRTVLMTHHSLWFNTTSGQFWWPTIHCDSIQCQDSSDDPPFTMIQYNVRTVLMTHLSLWFNTMLGQFWWPTIYYD